MAWKPILYVLAGYLGLTLLVFLSQRKMLYLPDKFLPSREITLNYGLQRWPAESEYRGYIGAKGAEAEQGTIIVFHGNAGNAFHRGYYLDALERLGYRVIISEYPGYGGRKGSPAEKNFVEDALETIRLAHKTYGSPIYLWGESLGAGVVSAAVKQIDLSVNGIVMMLPWDTLGKVAQTHYWFLPARWLVLDKYDNVKNLKGYDGNIAVVLAGRDEVIPVQHGRNLWNSIDGNKKLWEFENASHNRMPLEPHLPWWREVMVFLSE